MILTSQIYIYIYIYIHIYIIFFLQQQKVLYLQCLELNYKALHNSERKQQCENMKDALLGNGTSVHCERKEDSITPFTPGLKMPPVPA